MEIDKPIIGTDILSTGQGIRRKKHANRQMGQTSRRDIDLVQKSASATNGAQRPYSSVHSNFFYAHGNLVASE